MLVLRCQTCFEHVAQALDTIYKDLTRSSKHPLGGNAYLTLDNAEEPYLGGVRFTAMPPMKRFRYAYTWPMYMPLCSPVSLSPPFLFTLSIYLSFCSPSRSYTLL